MFEFVEFELAGFGELDSVAGEFPFDPGDEFFQDDWGVVELLFPREFLGDRLVGLFSRRDLFFLDEFDLFDYRLEFALVNVGFGPEESDFFFKLEKFCLELVLFVFLFFQFGLKLVNH